VGNLLLESLSPSCFRGLKPQLTKETLAKGQTLERAKREIGGAFFIESGIAAVLAEGSHGHVAVALIGCEGMTGVAVTLGARSSPYTTAMLTAGSGLRLDAAALRSAVDTSPEIRRLLLLYCLALNYQAAQTAYSNAALHIEARVARWVLMTHDRAGKGVVAISHEAIALMLGIRRSGVTVALNEMEKRGLLRLQRGGLLVVDPIGLRELAGDSYGLPEAEYSRLIRPHPRG
jgi:CRP-like cAMP-binding protein